MSGQDIGEKAVSNEICLLKYKKKTFLRKIELWNFINVIDKVPILLGEQWP